MFGFLKSMVSPLKNMTQSSTIKTENVSSVGTNLKQENISTLITNMADMLGDFYVVTVTLDSSGDLKITVGLKGWPITYEIPLPKGLLTEELSPPEDPKRSGPHEDVRAECECCDLLLPMVELNRLNGPTDLAYEQIICNKCMLDPCCQRWYNINDGLRWRILRD